MARTMTARSSAGHGLTRMMADDSGFTLAEVLVSLGLFVVISVTATYGLITTLKLTDVTKDRVVAANLATQELERLRSQNAANAQLDSTARTVTLRGQSFTVTPSLTPAATANCATGSSRKVSVIVTWNSNPARSARYDSVLSC
jgi:prepilin-type N-terminal cleavage/methylation domain-containing protein